MPISHTRTRLDLDAKSLLDGVNPAFQSLPRDLTRDVPMSWREPIGRIDAAVRRRLDANRRDVDAERTKGQFLADLLAYLTRRGELPRDGDALLLADARTLRTSHEQGLIPDSEFRELTMSLQRCTEQHRAGMVEVENALSRWRATVLTATRNQRAKYLRDIAVRSREPGSIASMEQCQKLEADATHAESRAAGLKSATANIRQRAVRSTS